MLKLIHQSWIQRLVLSVEFSFFKIRFQSGHSFMISWNVFLHFQVFKGLIQFRGISATHTPNCRMIVQANFNRDFMRNFFCGLWDLNPWPFNACLLAWALPSSRQFAILQRTTFVPTGSQCFGDLRAVSKIIHMFTWNTTQSHYILLSGRATASLAAQC